MDTAELTIAGIDPVKFYEKHHGRINHVHFKDAITADTLDEYKDLNAEIEYWPMHLCAAGAKRGIERWYYEMGTPGGLVDFPALKQALAAHGYDGWVVVESDQSPHAEESVMLNGWYLKQVLTGRQAWMTKDRRPPVSSSASRRSCLAEYPTTRKGSR